MKTVLCPVGCGRRNKPRRTLRPQSNIEPLCFFVFCWLIAWLLLRRVDGLLRPFFHVAARGLRVLLDRAARFRRGFPGDLAGLVGGFGCVFRGGLGVFLGFPCRPPCVVHRVLRGVLGGEPEFLRRFPDHPARIGGRFRGVFSTRLGGVFQGCPIAARLFFA